MLNLFLTAIHIDSFTEKKRLMLNILRVRNVVTILLCCLMLACAGTRVNPLSPEVEIVDVELKHMQFPVTTVNFTVNVSNPNSFDINIEYIDMKFYVLDQLLAEDKYTNIKRLQANKKQNMKIPVKLNVLSAIPLFTQINNDPQVPYNVSGFVKLDDQKETIPFTYKGSWNK